MITSSRIFAALFLALGIFCIGAVIYGATYQIFLAAICLSLSCLLMNDARKGVDGVEQPEPTEENKPY